MKKIISLISLFLSSALFATTVPPRVIELHTEKVKDVMHWVPETVTVKPGEKVKFVLKHELEGGFEFHGFKVDALKLEKQVNRNKTLEVETMIPKELKRGEYPIACQFHPAHAAAKLIVE